MSESMSFRFAAIFAGCLICSLPGSAQQLPANDVGRPTITAVRLTSDERVTVDGRLDEPAWQRAEPVVEFGQSDPRNGEPATERTAVRILFDQGSLYIGAELDDSNPDGVLGRQMFRDGTLDADDRLMWVLDPFNDQRSGSFFETNPAGVLSDAQLVAASNANVAPRSTVRGTASGSRAFVATTRDGPSKSRFRFGH